MIAGTKGVTSSGICPDVLMSFCSNILCKACQAWPAVYILWLIYIYRILSEVLAGNRSPQLCHLQSDKACKKPPESAEFHLKSLRGVAGRCRTQPWITGFRRAEI